MSPPRYEQLIAQLYDRRASVYDGPSENAVWHRRICRTLLERADLKAGQRVLDIATGTGTIALQAAYAVGSIGEVVGIDISPKMLTEAETKAAVAGLDDVIDFRLADAEQFQTETRFDHVFCCAAFIWMSNIPRALAHWRSLLVQGGMLHVQTHTQDAFLASKIFSEVALEHGINLKFHTPIGSIPKLERMICGAGFENVDVVEEPDFIEMDLKQMKSFVPDKDFPFPGQECSPLAGIDEHQCIAIREETLSRIEQAAVKNVVVDTRTSLFASARNPVRIQS